MDVEPQILEVLRLWQELKGKGLGSYAQPLGRDCPELLDEVRRQLEFVTRLGKLLARWQERSLHGKGASAAQIRQDSLELVHGVQQQAESLTSQVFVEAFAKYVRAAMPSGTESTSVAQSRLLDLRRRKPIHVLFAAAVMAVVVLVGLIVLNTFGKQATSEHRGTVGSGTRLAPEDFVGEIGCLRGHSGAVTGVAFSEDGAQAVSGSLDESVRLWDLVNRKQVQIYRGHEAAVTCVAFAGAGRLLSSGQDGTVCLWDCSRPAEPLFTIKSIGSSGMKELLASRDGQHVLSRNSANTVFFWNLAEGKLVGTWQEAENVVGGLAFSRLDEPCVIRQGSLQLQSGTKDKGVGEGLILWGLTSNKKLHHFQAKRESLKIAFAADGRQFATWASGRLRCWDVESDKLLSETATEVVPNGEVMMFPSGRRALTWSPLGRDLDRPAPTKEVKRSPQGGEFSVDVWDFEQGRRLRRFYGPETAVSCTAGSWDGRYALSGSQDGSIRVWALPPISLDDNTAPARGAAPSGKGAFSRP
jgi:WD40 repeat protein